MAGGDGVIVGVVVGAAWGGEGGSGVVEGVDGVSGVVGVDDVMGSGGI